jgi:hypothetical protein
LHPLLQEQANEFAQLPTTTHPNYYGRPGQQHAELNALSEALYTREAALGRSASASDRPALLLHVQQARGSGVGTPMPRCSRCNFIASDVDRTSQLAGAEKQQAQTILSGNWSGNRPF